MSKIEIFIKLRLSNEHRSDNLGGYISSYFPAENIAAINLNFI